LAPLSGVGASGAVYSRGMPASTTAASARHRVVSVGYEGRELDEFVLDLLARDVTVLADVRLNAVSRRRGFSKTALRTALEARGIHYVHLRGLGNPVENRAAFSGANVAAGQASFRRVLATEDGRRDLAALRVLASEAMVAVLCVERDEANCHRKVVIDTLDAL
jgi:uncharacterized protein (DUF488 family)